MIVHRRRSWGEWMSQQNGVNTGDRQLFVFSLLTVSVVLYPNLNQVLTIITMKIPKP